MPARLIPHAALLAALGSPLLGQETGDPTWHVVTDEIEVVELLEICARELELPLDYVPETIEGTVEVRSGLGVTIQGLWATTNRLLVERGFACVQIAGEDTLSVVKLDLAPTLARLEPGQPESARAGYIRVLQPIHSADGSELTSSLEALLPGDGTLVTSLSGDSHVVLAGLKPQVLQALQVLAVLDAVPSPVAVEEVRVSHVPPVTLAALLEQVAQKRKAIGQGELQGSVVADAATASLLVVAPSDEIPEWIDLIAQLDRAEARFTKDYVPVRFGVAETAQLIREVIAAGGAEPPGWRMIEDELTGTLIVTATVSQHQQVERTLERLEGTGVSARRALRSFPIEHRDAEDLIGLLDSLLEDGPSELLEPGIEDVQGATAPIERPLETVRPTDADVTLTADKGTNRILAFGDVRLLRELADLIESIDVQDPQVLVETIVVNLTESQMRDLGVELRARGELDSALWQVSSLFGLSSPDLTAGKLPIAAGSGATGVVLNPGNFSTVVRALEIVNDGRALSIPKVLVANHQDASLDSVLQAPYATLSATNVVATTAFGGTSDAGTSVTVTPHITSGDRLRLDYSVSISTFVGESADPNLPPPRLENLLDSTVTLPDGYSIVVGGLEMDTEAEAESRVPVLGSIPLVGWLFKSKAVTRERSRFFVFIRCTILRNDGFQDLKHISAPDLATAGVEDGWPVLEPRVMR